jgi:hypothetical protein
MKRVFIYCFITMVLFTSCKKDSSSKIAAPSRFQNLISGKYLTTEVCYHNICNGCSSTIDSTYNISWNVTAINDSTIVANSYIAWRDIHAPVITFYTNTVNQIIFEFDTLSNIYVDVPLDTNIVSFCGFYGHKRP